MSERTSELYVAGLQVGRAIARARAKVDDVVDNMREYLQGIEDAASGRRAADQRDEEETS